MGACSTAFYVESFHLLLLEHTVLEAIFNLTTDVVILSKGYKKGSFLFSN